MIAVSSSRLSGVEALPNVRLEGSPTTRPFAVGAHAGVFEGGVQADVLGLGLLQHELPRHA